MSCILILLLQAILHSTSRKGIMAKDMYSTSTDTNFHYLIVYIYMQYNYIHSILLCIYVTGGNVHNSHIRFLIIRIHKFDSMAHV